MSSGLDTLVGEHQIPARGRKMQDTIPVGSMLGNYFYLSPKKWGVEPGFLGVHMNDDFFDLVRAKYPKTQHISNEQIPDFIALNSKQLTSFGSISLGEELANYIVKNKLLKRYLIKQDYKDPGFIGGVAPSYEDYLRTSTYKAHIKKGNHNKGARFATWASRGRKLLRSTAEENRNAILECLANDVAIAAGMTCQEQSLIFGTYKNGKLKVMTRCLWDDKIGSLGNIRGNEDTDDHAKLDQEDYQPTLADGTPRFKDGRYFVKEGPNGLMISDDSVSDLGEQLTLLISQGDRDVLGSKGSNKHKKEGKFYGLDFGQAYRKTNPLVGSLKDDFTFKQPGSVFKNMSALTDNSLAEKMKGVHLLNKFVHGIEPPQTVIDQYGQAFKDRLNKTKAGGARNTFDTYIAKFESLKQDAITRGEKKKAKEYSSILMEIKKSKQYSIDANLKILSVFEARLKLTPEQLDVLEAFEKVTSKTSLRSPDNRILLNYAKVERRVEWQMHLVGTKCKLTSIGKPEQLDLIMNKLEDYLTKNGKTMEDLGLNVKVEKNNISVEFEKSTLQHVANIFNELQVQQVKHTADYYLRTNFLNQQTLTTTHTTSSETHYEHTTDQILDKLNAIPTATNVHEDSVALQTPTEHLLSQDSITKMQTEFTRMAKESNNSCTEMTKRKDGSYEASWKSTAYSSPTKMIVYDQEVLLARFDVDAFRETIKLLHSQNKKIELDHTNLEPSQIKQLQDIIEEVTKKKAATVTIRDDISITKRFTP